MQELSGRLIANINLAFSSRTRVYAQVVQKNCDTDVKCIGRESIRIEKKSSQGRKITRTQPRKAKLRDVKRSVAIFSMHKFKHNEASFEVLAFLIIFVQSYHIKQIPETVPAGTRRDTLQSSASIVSSGDANVHFSSTARTYSWDTNKQVETRPSTIMVALDT
uniref:Uncharacterized protein n=1 Tax=Cucumis melo TaxID=3656 RepID=A0A9I9E8R5_CUCME